MDNSLTLYTAKIFYSIFMHYLLDYLSSTGIYAIAINELTKSFGIVFGETSIQALINFKHYMVSGSGGLLDLLSGPLTISRESFSKILDINKGIFSFLYVSQTYVEIIMYLKYATVPSLTIPSTNNGLIHKIPASFVTNYNSYFILFSSIPLICLFRLPIVATFTAAVYLLLVVNHLISSKALEAKLFLLESYIGLISLF